MHLRQLLLLAPWFALGATTFATISAPSHCLAASKKNLVKSVALVDALTGKPIEGFSPLVQGAIVNLATLSTRTLNLTASAKASVRQLRFFVNGRRYSIDSARPFRIAENKNQRSNKKKGKKKPATSNTPPAIWPLQVGTHTVRVVPYGSNRAIGSALSISFTVIDEFVRDAAAPPIPKLAEWEANMVKYGQKHCDATRISELGTWEGNVWYYDGARVYLEIADYTKDPAWDTCAALVRNVYRDYVLNNGGLLPGWRVFPHGLYEDYVRSKDDRSRQAVLLLAKKSAYAYSAGSPDYQYSRETAQIISTYLLAEQLGQPLDPDIKKSVAYALGHLDQWVNGQADFFQPYLVALTFEALIDYHERTGDSRILPAVQKTADWLWENFWNPAAKDFYYISCKPGSTQPECSQPPAPHGDLNLLIVPVYGWLYRKTGDVRYLTIGDEIFAAGVQEPFVAYGKQFVQAYRWSFNYVKWRLGAQ